MARNFFRAMPQADLEALFLSRLKGYGKTVVSVTSGDVSTAFQADMKADSVLGSMATALVYMDPDKWPPEIWLPNNCTHVAFR